MYIDSNNKIKKIKTCSNIKIKGERKKIGKNNISKKKMEKRLFF